MNSDYIDDLNRKILKSKISLNKKYTSYAIYVHKKLEKTINEKFDDLLSKLIKVNYAFCSDDELNSLEQIFLNFINGLRNDLMSETNYSDHTNDVVNYQNNLNELIDLIELNREYYERKAKYFKNMLKFKEQNN